MWWLVPTRKYWFLIILASTPTGLWFLHRRVIFSEASCCHSVNASCCGATVFFSFIAAQLADMNSYQVSSWVKLLEAFLLGDIVLPRLSPVIGVLSIYSNESSAYRHLFSCLVDYLWLVSPVCHMAERINGLVAPLNSIGQSLILSKLPYRCLLDLLCLGI